MLVELINFILKKHKSSSANLKQTLQLITIAYYFLLQVEEYTKPKHKIDTVQFHMIDVAFQKRGNRIDYKTVSLQELLTCNGATLRIENKKNGVKKQIIFYESHKGEGCPVKILVDLVHNIWIQSQDKYTLICAFK